LIIVSRLVNGSATCRLQSWSD